MLTNAFTTTRPFCTVSEAQTCPHPGPTPGHLGPELHPPSSAPAQNLKGRTVRPPATDTQREPAGLSTSDTRPQQPPSSLDFVSQPIERAEPQPCWLPEQLPPCSRASLDPSSGETTQQGEILVSKTQTKCNEPCASPKRNRLGGRGPVQLTHRSCARAGSQRAGARPSAEKRT